MRPRARTQRSAVKTLLIVGEGETEVAFLTHLKALYAPRGCNLIVRVICAHGKGAKHVVEVAIRYSQNAAFDCVAALLDADTDWTAKVRRRAEEHRIRLLLSRPRIEAMLLRALGRKTGHGKDEQKRRLARVVKDPLVAESYAAVFDIGTLQKARHRERVIDELLQLFVM